MQKIFMQSNLMTAEAKPKLIETATSHPIIISISFLLNTTINLFDYVDKARWASGQLIDSDNTANNSLLPFMGGQGDSNGFVRLDDGVVMEDRQSYRALRTHPKWVNNGTIKGWLPWVKQNGSGIFKAQVGFLNGATGTDGVTFQVWVHYHVNGEERWDNVVRFYKKYSGQLQEISADLSNWANQEISIELRVDAGLSSGQDWAAWINPRIEVKPVIVQVPAPIIISDNPSFYNDRFDINKKWFLPVFTLKQPLKDAFFFSVSKNAEPDDDGNPTFNGEVSFTLVKNTPTAITALMTSNPEITYTEVPLNNFAISFVLAFKSKQPVTYTGNVIITNNEYEFSLKPDPALQSVDQEAYLLRLFNFISNRDNAEFCTIEVTGSYLGYIPRPLPLQLNIYQNAFRDHQNFLMKPENRMISTGVQSAMMMRSHVMINPSSTLQAEVPITLVDHPQDNYTINEAVPFSKIIEGVNFPCSGADGYPTNYFIKMTNPDQEIPFACHLPFGSSIGNFTYAEFTPHNVILTNYGINRIYLNTYNYNYLIIPQKYTIMLEHPSDSNPEDVLVPAVYLNTVIDDADAGNCKATFQFHIAPYISEYQINAIKKLIYSNSPAGAFKSLDEITIEFPESVHSPDTIAFNKVNKSQLTFLGAYNYGVQGSKYFQLEFQNVLLGDGSAGVIADIIKGQMGGTSLVSAFTFDVDSASGLLPVSAIELSLNLITGNGLSLQKNETDGKIYFLNRTLNDITVSSMVTDLEVMIDPKLVVSKNSTVVNDMSLPAPVSISDANYLTAIPHYFYNSNSDYNNSVLAEMRLDVQNVSDSIIVTNNTGLFGIYKIKQIDILIYLLPTGVSDYTKALRTIAGSIIKDGVINYMPFILPVGVYSTKWSAVYSTSIEFTDGSNQQNNVQVIEDINTIGKVLNLTVLNLNLSKSTY